MAADEFMASESGRRNEIILRIYSWDKPTLSLGFHQKITAEQLLRCREHNLPIVRRPTGGRAVLHDQEITYAITIPSEHDLLRGGRDAVLKDIGSAFTEAAQSVGLKAELVRGSTKVGLMDELKRGSPLCFDSLSRWEIRLEGRKWIGSAQRFLPRAFLQHGSILTGQSSVDLAKVLGLPQAAGALSIRAVEVMALRQAVVERLGERLSISWQESTFCDDDFEAINRLIKERMDPTLPGEQ
jgi:lipoate-protein ligase A